MGPNEDREKEFWDNHRFLVAEGCIYDSDEEMPEYYSLERSTEVTICSSQGSLGDFDMDYSMEDVSLYNVICQSTASDNENKSITDTDTSSSDELDKDESTTPFDRVLLTHSELILQHLSGNEIKIASEVSKKWMRKIFHSRHLMSKFVLRVDIDDPQDCGERFASLVKTTRHYTDVAIKIGNNKQLIEKVDRILMKISRSVRHLKLVKIGGFNSMLRNPLEFFELETLALQVVCGRLCGGFLANVCSLKKLSVNGLDPEGLILCLQQNPLLEELKLFENSWISYFFRDISVALPFKLKKLTIADHFNTESVLQPGEFPAPQWDNISRINFKKLLKSQASSLQSLSIDSCFAEDLNGILKCLPALQCLEVNRIIGDVSKLSLESYSNIRTFTAASISDNLLHAIIGSFKNLHSLSINKLKTHQFFFIARHARNLQNFTYFWASETEKKYGNLIELNHLYQKYHKHANFSAKLKIIRESKCRKVVDKTYFEM